jgi:hypothetical protein
MLGLASAGDLASLEVWGVQNARIRRARKKRPRFPSDYDYGQPRTHGSPESARVRHPPRRAARLRPRAGWR